jgi:hypothetical protein
MSDSFLSFAFPNMWKIDALKDEEYHKECVTTIVSQTIGSGFYPNLYATMDSCMRFYNGDATIDNKFDFLQSSANGQSLPAVWINYNKIRNKINLLEGELSAQEFKVHVNTINKDAVNRKMQAKHRIMADKLMSELLPEIDPTGELLPEPTTKYKPYSEEELDLYMRSSYKETVERAMESILGYEVKRNKYKSMRLALGRDVFIAGRAVCAKEVVNNRAQLRRVDPRKFIIDPYVDDDFFTTAAYCGEWDYVPLSQIAETYGLSLKELESTASNPNTWAWRGYSSGGTEWLMPFTMIENQNYGLVLKAQWKDITQMRCKITKDKYGNEHVKVLGKDEKATLTNKEKEAGAYIETRNIETIRKGELIGGQYLRNWGELTNQLRESVDDMSTVRFTYSCVSPQYVNYRSVSKAEELRALQEFKDLIMYTIQLEMSTAGRKGFIYDAKFKPENMTIQDVMYYLKVSGIAFTNSGKEELPVTGNPFPTIDTGLTDTVNLYLNIAAYIDQEIDKVSGINDARSGYQKGSDLVGVTQIAMMQSSLITLPIFQSFETFENALFQDYANYIKTIWPLVKEQYVPIISELNVDVVSVDEEIPLQDYGIFCSVTKDSILNDRSKFEQMLMFAVQANSLPIQDALILLYEPDVKTAIKKFMALQERREQMQMQAQQQMASQQSEQNLVEKEADVEAQLAIDKGRSENKAALMEMKEMLKQSTNEQSNAFKERLDQQDKQFQILLEAIKERDSK